jgi:RNA polymerase sigma factor (sigma-70 family)
MYETDSEILEGCRHNNRKSQEELYNKYSGLFLGICMRYMKHRGEAEDAMMEGFMKIYKTIPTFNLTGTFEGWMKRIIVFTAIDRYRKLSSMHLDELKTEDLSIDEDIIDNISVGDILKLMDELPERQRIITNLYAIEGYSHKEISEILGISEGTSKSQLYKGKESLKNMIEKTFFTQTKN